LAGKYKTGLPGTDVVIFYIFSQKIDEKCRFLLKAELTLSFEKNVENSRK
jgi:hypothetical protein